MKAENFRVGNLVIVENSLRDESGYFHKITEVRQLDCQVQLNKMDIIYGQKYKNIKPIPLTEELHNKFGIIKNSFLNFEYPLTEKLKLVFANDYVFLRQASIKGKYDDDLVTVWNKDIKKRDMYVHELQNIYYWFTNNELVFSEA